MVAMPADRGTLLAVPSRHAVLFRLIHRAGGKLLRV
jgi:hypothetical protein